MTDVISGIFSETAALFTKMAPYLIFGYLFAGVLHIFFDARLVSRHLGKGDLASVVKASLFGIPLPLCSCSVIPAAMSLRKEGASRGSVLSFLISAPTTGVDSIFATYALLGWFFTIYRILASFVTGIFAGVMSNIFIKGDAVPRGGESSGCKLCDGGKGHEHGYGERVKGVFSYAFGTLLADTGPAILGGVLIGGMINYFMPGDFLSKYLGSGVLSMLVMLAVGIPMYVCATASIPIAAALMAKGISPGAALVFLIAGPATNIVTMAVVSRNMGKKALIVYLLSIISGSMILGFIMNLTNHGLGSGIFAAPEGHSGHTGQAAWETLSSVILFSLIVYGYFRRKYLLPKEVED